MKINHDRMLADLNVLRSITDTPGEGVTRFSYGEKDREARAYITRAAESAGFVVDMDAIGNVFINFKGAAQGVHETIYRTSGSAYNEAQRIVVGSHMDTVKNGGWLDGIYGVIAGLEVMRTLSESKLQGKSEKGSEGGSLLAKPVELVIFAEEEGSNFGSTMTGSKFISGIYGEEELDKLKNDRGVSLRQMLERCGYPPYKREDVAWDFDRVLAMLELHIEQGPGLEQKGLSIGIVDAIYGMSVLEITLYGVGNHAGAAPMADRRDALVTAALCILEAEKIAKGDPEGITVATVGKISVLPNCSNVIPEKAVFTLEVRDKDENKIHQVMGETENSIRTIAAQRGVDCETRKMSSSAPIKMNEEITALIANLASQAGFSYEIISSGAVHDTCMIAPNAPAGMIFVPSKGGRSHVPFEDTDEEDLVRGSQLLLDTVRAL